MNESTARAERFGLPASPSGSSPASAYYLWEVPNKPVGVRLNLDVVDRLEREVVEFFRSLSSRGSELGGLLLGTVPAGHSGRVSIDSYELVPCDYVRGPLYQFSEADTERFQRALEQRNSSGGLRVVGYFRSHTRKNLSLDAEDLAFFTAHFREPHHVALLIRPYASKASTAGIFIREAGVVRGESSYLEFPFRRSELERMPQPEPKAPPEPAPAATDTAAPVSEPAVPKAPPRAQIVPIASRREISAQPPLPERSPLRSAFPSEPPAPPRFAEKAPAESSPAKPESPSPAFLKSPAPPYPKPPAPQPEKEREGSDLSDISLPPLERPRSSGKIVAITAAAATVLLLLSGALIYPGFSHKSRPPVVPPAGSPALSLHVERSASELLLSWNRDSDAIKNAAHGTLAITDGDQHENVNLDVAQLRTGSIVYSPTGSDVTFQLSIVGQNSSQTSSELVRILKTRPSPMADNAPAAPQASQKAPGRTEAAIAATASAANLPAAPAASNQPDAETRPKKTAVREFHPEALSERLRPAGPADLPEAPGLIASAAPAPLPAALPGLNATPAMPAALPRPAAPSAPKVGGQLRQAQVISSKPPEYPLVAKQAHVQGVVVVSATVGTDGKVKSASAVSGPPLLQKAAVDAVKQWTYKPTTLNGAPVESETRVEVRFTTAN